MGKQKEKPMEEVSPRLEERPPTTSLRIVAGPTEDTPSYYCNFVETVCSPHEMALNFVRVPTKLTAAQTEEAKGGTLNLEPAVQVFFAPTLLPALVRALTALRENFERQFGAIREDGDSTIGRTSH